MAESWTRPHLAQVTLCPGSMSSVELGPQLTNHICSSSISTTPLKSPSDSLGFPTARADREELAENALDRAAICLAEIDSRKQPLLVLSFH